MRKWLVRALLRLARLWHWLERVTIRLAARLDLGEALEVQADRYVRSPDRYARSPLTKR